MKDLNTSALLKMDLALKNTITRADNVAGAQAAWRFRLRVRWGARDRARAGALTYDRLREALVSAAAGGARGLMRAGFIAPRRERVRLLVLLRDRPTSVLVVLRVVVFQGPGSAPGP